MNKHNDERETNLEIKTMNVKQESEVAQESKPVPADDIALRDAHEAAGALAFLASGGPHQPLPSSSIYQQTSLPYVGSSSSNHTETLPRITDQHPPQVDVKVEPLQSPVQSPTAQDNTAAVDAETAKAIAAAQNEYNTRVRGPKKQAEATTPVVEAETSESASKSTATTVNTPPVAVKKRPAPKSISAIKATSPATKNPPSKKRKVDSSDDRATSVSSQQSPAPSVGAKTKPKTPSAVKGKRNPIAVPSKADSPAIPGSPSAVSDASDDEVYCICRRPDDHTFMIGCDGGCDDWFHGKCVGITKDDENLIDKFICPLCTEKDRGITTWKPMCRREGCRKPARLRKGDESKYCSNSCGVQFMASTVKHAAAKFETTKSSKKQKSVGQEKTAIDLPSAHLDEDIGPLGGRIRTHELKSLTGSASNAEDFRRLGSAPLLTPPQSESPDLSRSLQEENDNNLQPDYSEQETQRLAEIEERKQTLKQQRQLLKERGQFVTLMKAQRDKTAERLKVKDVCGFDSRWSLDDVAFKAWRESGEVPSTLKTESPDSTSNGDLDEHMDTENDSKILNGVSPVTPSGADTNNYVCTKKRCERHRQWQKLVLQDVRFEEADVGNEMRRIDAEEKEIKQRALQRAKGLKQGHSEAKQSSAGWVEVVPDHDATDAVAVEHGLVVSRNRDEFMGGS